MTSCLPTTSDGGEGWELLEDVAKLVLLGGIVICVIGLKLL
jgi:hypothetical protein